jgi:hypothetical protein
VAEPIVERFVERLREGRPERGDGRFGAEMEVELVNDGPFTLSSTRAPRTSQTFSAVRMQREQALMRTGEPLRWTTIGCRLGSQAAQRALAVHADRLGVPAGDRLLPQMSQARAMGISVS